MYSLHHIHVNQKNLTLSFPPSKRQGLADTNHQRIMEKGKSIMYKRDLSLDQDMNDMVLGIFLDSMTTDFPNQVAIDEQIDDNLNKGNIQKMVAGILLLPPLEQCLLPLQRPAQSNQKMKHKQISKENNDQERRRPHNDLIPMSYEYLLPILVNTWEIMPKQIEPAKFPTIVSMFPMSYMDIISDT